MFGDGFGVTQMDVETGSVEVKRYSEVDAANATFQAFDADATRAAILDPYALTVIVLDVDNMKRLQTITYTRPVPFRRGWPSARTAKC